MGCVNMKAIRIKGNNIEEAKQLALKQLEVEIDEVEINIISMGSKGFLGLGKRKAEVEVKVLNLLPKKAEKYIEELLKNMGIECVLKSTPKNKHVSIKITSTKDDILIGVGGKTLEAIEHLVNLSVNKGGEKYLNIYLDIGDYKKNKEKDLTNLAKRAEEIVSATKRNKKLKPMSRYERKIIHKELQDSKVVKTISEGYEPKRYIVVKPKTKEAYKGK